MAQTKCCKKSLQKSTILWHITGKKSRVEAPVRIMVLNATFNNISVILWRSVLLVEETDLLKVTDRLYHTMLY